MAKLLSHGRPAASKDTREVGGTSCGKLSGGISSLPGDTWWQSSQAADRQFGSIGETHPHELDGLFLKKKTTPGD